MKTLTLLTRNARTRVQARRRPRNLSAFAIACDETDLLFFGAKQRKETRFMAKIAYQCKSGPAGPRRLQ